MDQTLTLISNRREEVLKVIAEAEKTLASARAELQDLEVSGKTVAALTGAEWVEISAGDATASSPASSVFARDLTAYAGWAVEGKKPVSQMILEIMDNLGDTVDMVGGIAPKEMRTHIKDTYGRDALGEYVSTQMWRLAEKGKLETVSKGHYRLKKS